MQDDLGDSLDATWSRTAGSRDGVPTTGARVPGLTILYHPDGERIGERTVLPGLDAQCAVQLSRRVPEFAAPGAAQSRPLDDRGLSRTPIVLERGRDHVVVDRGASRTRLRVDGQAVDNAVTVAAEALDRGVALLLGGRVVLLLHRLDPLADLGLPRFGLLGESPQLIQVRRDIVQVADLDVPILIRGESGTGKELVARAIHAAGPRKRQAYVAINMAAIPSALAAAELFGAERGAYTGADRPRPGHFERADGGSLFLDEIGETPLEVQALLLRALESGDIQRVGSDRAHSIDTRVISATDADLETAIDAGRFRGPLLHRLSGYVLRLPPLRHRREDFGRLFVHFLRRELGRLDIADRLAPRRHPWLPATLVDRLARWHWPGNVRQLANVVRQLAIANRGADPAHRFDEVEALLSTSSTESTAIAPARSGPPPLGAVVPPSGPRKPADLHEGEVVAALRAHRFRPAAAADALGIARSSIYALIDKIPSLRKAAELSREEIDDARRRAGPSLEAVAADLEVSERALRRRLGELGSS